MGAEYQESGAKVELVEVGDPMHSITLQASTRRAMRRRVRRTTGTPRHAKIAVPYTHN